jgi:hypothetical protein
MSPDIGAQRRWSRERARVIRGSRQTNCEHWLGALPSERPRVRAQNKGKRARHFERHQIPT